MDTKIEKANIGDTKVGVDGVLRQYVQLENGKKDWRRVKGNATATPKPNPTPEKTETEEPKKNQKPDDNVAPVKTQAQLDAEYGAPKPRVKYSQAPDKDAPFRAAETWRVGSNTKVLQHRNAVRKVYADSVKTPDDLLLKILNNEKGNENTRQLAYEEAAARGIPEHKINIKGSLEGAWRKAKNFAEYQRIINERPEDAAENTYNDKNLHGMDVDAFIAQFPEGDTSWSDKNNPIVKKEFHNFTSLTDRQRFDAMVDYVKRQDPQYADAFEQMRQLNGMYGFVMDSNFQSKDHSPMLVSAGAAGAGKTTGFKQVADFLGMEIFDDKKHTPGDSDYHIVWVDKDVEDEKDLIKLISEHNGKILLFDDKDKLLVTSAGGLIKTMKQILDSDPDNRKFHNTITGKSDIFTGTFVFTTNKTAETLNMDEDHKAIMSRGMFSDVHFTINEAIDLLRDRYKTMGGRMRNVSKQEEDDIRQYVFDFIEEHIDQLDPDKFTVRSFTNTLKAIDASMWSNNKSASSTQGSNLFGKQVQWKRNLLSMLNKAMVIDIEKALLPGEFGKDMSMFKNFSEETIARMKTMYKKDPKKFTELFGEDIVKFVENGKDEKVEKAYTPDFGSMSLEEAENLLFG